MSNKKFIVKGPTKAKINISKSNFISYLYPITNEEEFKSLHQKIKNEHHSASHIAFAYIIENKSFYSDDGEPKNSAGKPIFNTINKFSLINVAIFVVRYFGGIKLGIRGLIDAYSSAAQKVIEIAELVDYEELLNIQVEVNENVFYKILELSKKIKFNIQIIENNDLYKLNIKIEKSKIENFYKYLGNYLQKKS